MFKNIAHSMQWPCSGMSGMCDERSGMDTSLSEEKYGVDLMRTGSENIKVEYRVRQYNSADGDYYELKGWRQIGDGFYEFSVSVDKHVILQGGPTILEFSYSVIDAAYFSLSSQVDVVGNWRRLYTLILESRLVRACEEGEDYRFGFNGMEKDNEVKGRGNSINYTYRMNDPRIGRFFAVDLLYRVYPDLTPYQTASNNPIGMSELEGLEGVPVARDPKWYIVEGFRQYMDAALNAFNFKAIQEFFVEQNQVPETKNYREYTKTSNTTTVEYKG